MMRRLPNTALVPKRPPGMDQGFTLIELLIVIGLIAILTGLTFVNLGRPEPTVSLATTADTLVSDLKSQQLLAMTGDVGSTAAQQPHGIYIQSGSYILFADAAYTSSDANNFTVTVDPNITISTTFPSSQVIFTTGNGAVQGWTNSTDTITLTSTSLGTTKTITIDRYGAIVTS